MRKALQRAPAAEPAPPRDRLWLYLLLSVLGTAGFFYVNIGAALVDGMVGPLGFTSAQAGNVMSANIYGNSVGGLVAVFAVRRFPWRPVVASLLCAVSAMDLASMLVHSYHGLLLLRAVNGVIAGVSIGVALSLLARTRFPDRAFAALVVFQFAVGGIGMWLLPGIVETHGTWPLFAAMVALDAVALATALFLRLNETPSIHAARAGRDRRGENAAGKRWLALVSATLVALFLFQAGQMGLAAFIIPLGRQGALALPFISQTLAWAAWIGALGALAVIAIGTRLGRSGPLAAAMLVTLVAITGFYFAPYPSVFFAANALSAFTWAMVVPYLFGIVSALDRTGRLATLGGFVSGLGLATGPLFAGWLARPQDYVPMISVALAFLVVSAIAMVPAAARVDRSSRAPVSGTT